MSTVVDSRVAELRFDNRQFESGVATSLSTLEKLKQRLNFQGTAKGLESVGTAANNIRMDGLSNGIETVKAKFSALQVIGTTALANITNSALNAGKRIASALTIDPIKTGFEEYELKMNSIQTIMSNTASKGTTMADVTKVIDELNTYADKTIYNFAEMTRNIGTFTAAGVGLNESAAAIQGIANLAAASGSNSQQASTAMYQLSQALAAGTVKLMDWNSVVNAGMGGEKFQEALKATAREHGIAVDDIIKKQGSFRDSLQEGWLSAEVMTDTLNKFTVDGAKKYAQSMMESGKWTQKQADALIKEAQSMEDAATKVKTLTQLWDTLKEAAQSGWGQSWEIITGNFEEAKELFTGVSDTIGNMIGASANARNEVLQGWKDMGGRKAIIDAVSNSFHALMDIAKPIKEAFREVFPPLTAKQLYNFSISLKELTEKFKISEKSAENLKSTFKGVFSIFGIGIDALKAFGKGAVSLLGAITGVRGGLLEITGAVGNYISKFREGIQETHVFETVVGGIAKALTSGINALRDFTGNAGEAFSSFSQGLSEAFNNIDFSKGLDAVVTGLFGGTLLSVTNFMDRLAEGMTSPFEGAGGVLKNIKGVLDDVRGCFKAYQEQLKAAILLKIATAIGVLAAALFVISTIDGVSLAKSLTALTVLFAEMMGALQIYTKISANLGGVMKSCAVMLSLSTAITILAGALKMLSTIDTAGIVRGLVAIGVLMGELLAFLKLAGGSGKIKIATVGLIGLASAMLILSAAVKNFGSMGLAEIGKGLLAMAGAFGLLSVAMKIIPKSTILTGAGLIVLSVALKTLASALSDFGGMSWSEITTGLIGLGGSLAVLATGLKLMKGSLAGSAALLVAAGALAMLAPVMKSLGNMSWGGIAKSLVALAGAFTVLGLAGLVLSPLLPAILGLSGAFALLGVGMVGIGAGLTMIAAGFTTLAAAGAVGATAFVASLQIIVTGIIELIPTAMKAVGEGIAAFCSVIAEFAPDIANSVLILLSAVLSSAATYVPQIVDSLMVLLIGVLNGLAARMPELIQAGVNVISSLFEGIATALGGMDFSSFVRAVVGVGLMSALMVALSSITGFIPGAMAGVLGMGAVVAEMGLVLAAIGGLAQIPGLTWLMSEGGNFLQTLGTAIGQFIGGLAGGVAQGFTSSMPEMATNLSAFMTNLQPFIDGAKSIDASMAEGIKALAVAVLALTAADLLDGLARFVTGGNSLSQFGQQLAPFGQSLQQYGAAVAGVDSEAIANSAVAAKALAAVADAIPNQGGALSIFSGENDISEFGTKLVPFGEGLKAYSAAVAGIDAEAISASAKAAKALTGVADAIPNEGGFASLFAGENDISTFGSKLKPLGSGLKEYSTAVAGIDLGAVDNSVSAVKSIANMLGTLSNVKTSGVASFNSALKSLSKANVDGFIKAFSGSSGKAQNAGAKLMASVVSGVKSKQSSLTAAANTIVSSFSKTLSSKTDSIMSAGKTLSAALADGIKSKQETVRSAINALVQGASSSIRSNHAGFYSSGSYLGDGLVSGINAKQSAAYSAGYNLGQKAVQGERDGQKSKSPSKLTIQSGKWLGEGLIIGIKKMTEPVYKAGRSVGETAANSMSQSISKIARIMDSDMDFAPTIRPVVDLDGVRLGTKAINGMLGLGHSIGVTANLNAINAAMSRTNQNAGNEEVVSAINKLRKDLGNVGNTTYQIDGVTYDDGSNVSQAVETLVRAAKIERRT